MARTEVNSLQIKDGSIKREDLNITIPAQAVITNIVAGENIILSSTGVDPGTGEVTITAKLSGANYYRNIFI